jgi:DNA topoisomerase-1
VGYTARMEEELDRIEDGELVWTDALREFQKKFETDLDRARVEMRDVKREAIPTDQNCDKCGKPMVLKWGRFGQFLACSGYPDCKNTRDPGADVETSNGDRAGLRSAAKVAKVKTEPNPIEAEAAPCEKCGSPMVLRRGRFGPFLACSAYPDCKTTRKITMNAEGQAEAKPEVLLDEKCPRCDAKLAVKQGRYGEFTSCSNYPTCRFVKMKETAFTARNAPRARSSNDAASAGRSSSAARTTRTATSSCGSAPWTSPAPNATALTWSSASPRRTAASWSAIRKAANTEKPEAPDPRRGGIDDASGTSPTRQHLSFSERPDRHRLE